MSKELILVIEDDPDIAELVEYNLTREGYRVLSATSGERGLELARLERPSLILLDLMLPGIPGLEVCRRLRREVSPDVPLIMLTAKSEEVDIVTGLELGADDYITKPFSLREFLARVGAVIRRRPTENGNGQPMTHGLVTIDPERHEVYVEGEQVELTLAEYRLLSALAAAPGRVYSRERLVGRITAGGYHISERNVDVHVAALRRKLRNAGPMITTVRGVGYRFGG